MQIIFAAPFILAAGILFTALTAIPRVRRWAIPIPTGVIAAGPSSLLVFLLDAFIRYRFGGRIGPADRWDLAAFIAGGAIGGVLAAHGHFFAGETCLVANRVVCDLRRAAVSVAVSRFLCGLVQLLCRNCWTVLCCGPLAQPLAFSDRRCPGSLNRNASQLRRRVVHPPKIRTVSTQANSIAKRDVLP